MQQGIRSEYWGLGDAIQFSTMPELYKSRGDVVSLCSDNKYSQQIKKMIWNSNPFVDGEQDVLWTIGDKPGIHYVNTTDSFIKNWEVVFGFPPTNDLPYINYSPIKDASFKNKILIDLTGKSLFPYCHTEPHQKALKKYPKDRVVLCSFPDGITKHVYDTEEYEHVLIQDLWHYANLLSSCEKYVCLNSGGQSLAAAMQRNCDIDVECLIERVPVFEWSMANKLFIYTSIKYTWI